MRDDQVAGRCVATRLTAAVATALVLTCAHINFAFADASPTDVPVAIASPLPTPASVSPATITPVPPATVTPPATPAGLPRGIEALPARVAPSSCDPVAKPGVTAFRTLVLAAYPDTHSDGITAACTLTNPTAHQEGRAWRWTIAGGDPHQVAEATALLTWLTAPDSSGHPAALARRLGVQTVTWNGHTFDLTRRHLGWRDTPCAQPTCMPADIDITFAWAGAMKRTSFWSHRVASADFGPCRPADLSWAPSYTAPQRTPCPASPPPTWPDVTTTAAPYLAELRAWSGATLHVGASGPGVIAVQQAMGVTADGAFGPQTAKGLSAWQAGHGLAPSATVTADTWRQLLTSAMTTTVTSPPTPLSPPARNAPPSPPTPAGAVAAQQVLTLVAAQAGKPYQYGGAGPDTFDCSGLTRFVFAEVGVTLPHNAAAQYAAVRPVADVDKRPGDLIFRYDASGIYHVSIYAGGNQMWAATHTGDVVRIEALPASNYKVGRALPD